MEQQPTNGEAQLRALALRLLPPLPSDEVLPSTSQLLVGRMPDTLPVNLPLIDGSRVLGSLVRGQQITIVADSSRPAQEVLDWYRDRLQATGWTMPELPRPGGFTPTFLQQFMGLVFCASPRGPSLTVRARDVPSEPTQVTLQLNTDPRQTPCLPGNLQPGFFGLHSRLPALAAPSHARQLQGGSSGGSNQAYSTATLETDLDLPALVAHYTQQLKQDGWTQTGAGQNDMLAWSSWTLVDEAGEPVRGLFLIVDRPDVSREYFLHLQIEYPDAARQMIGSTSMPLPYSG